MKTITRFVAAVALAGAVSASPALAGGWNWGGSFHHGSGGSSSPGGSSSGGATQVPEPADAALFALGVAGVALGRRLRPRKKG